MSLLLFSVSGIAVYGGLTFWNLSLAGVPVKRVLLILARYLLLSLPASLLLFLLRALNVAPVWLTVTAVGTSLVYYLVILRDDPELLARLQSLARFRRD